MIVDTNTFIIRIRLWSIICLTHGLFLSDNLDKRWMSFFFHLCNHKWSLCELCIKLLREIVNQCLFPLVFFLLFFLSKSYRCRQLKVNYIGGCIFLFVAVRLAYVKKSNSMSRDCSIRSKSKQLQCRQRFDLVKK